MKSQIRCVFHRGKCTAICHSQDDSAKNYMHSFSSLSISTWVNGVFSLCLPPQPEFIFNSLAVSVPVWWLEVLTTARNWLLQSWHSSYYQPIQFLVPAQRHWVRWKCCNPLPNSSVSPGHFFCLFSLQQSLEWLQKCKQKALLTDWKQLGTSQSHWSRDFVMIIKNVLSWCIILKGEN